MARYIFDLTWSFGRGRRSNSRSADSLCSLSSQVLDFNSLYPTIIQEYNICFTTVQPGTQREDDAVNDDACTDCESPSLFPHRRMSLGLLGFAALDSTGCEPRRSTHECAVAQGLRYDMPDKDLNPKP
jgi:hypothetical protein